MHYLPYLSSVDAEITIEKLDKAAKTLSDKIKSFAKLFVILLSWCIFNLILSLFFTRTRSLSLDTYRLITEGLRNLDIRDLLFVLTFVFDDRLCCIISSAVLLWGGVALFVSLIELCDGETADVQENKHERFVQHSTHSETYVVSYKQQVAFLA